MWNVCYAQDDFFFASTLQTLDVQTSRQQTGEPVGAFRNLTTSWCQPAATPSVPESTSASTAALAENTTTPSSHTTAASLGLGVDRGEDAAPLQSVCWRWHMSVPVCVRAQVCTCVCACERVHVCALAHMHVCVRAHVHVCLHARARMHVCVHMCAHVRMCVRTMERGHVAAAATVPGRRWGQVSGLVGIWRGHTPDHEACLEVHRRVDCEGEVVGHPRVGAGPSQALVVTRRPGQRHSREGVAAVRTPLPPPWWSATACPGPTDPPPRRALTTPAAAASRPPAGRRPRQGGAELSGEMGGWVGGWVGRAAVVSSPPPPRQDTLGGRLRRQSRRCNNGQRWEGFVLGGKGVDPTPRETVPQPTLRWSGCFCQLAKKKIRWKPLSEGGTGGWTALLPAPPPPKEGTDLKPTEQKYSHPVRRHRQTHSQTAMRNQPSNPNAPSLVRVVASMLLPVVEGSKKKDCEAHSGPILTFNPTNLKGVTEEADRCQMKDGGCLIRKVNCGIPVADGLTPLDWWRFLSTTFQWHKKIEDTFLGGGVGSTKIWKLTLQNRDPQFTDIS